MRPPVAQTSVASRQPRREHLAQTGLRVGVVLLGLQPDDLISLGLGHGVAVRDHEVRVQAERARVAQTAVGAGKSASGCSPRNARM